MPAGDININAQFEDDASAPIKNPPQITAFMINGVSAVINSDTKAITIILPYGTDLKHVAPTIVTANASKVEPSSAQRVDLSIPFYLPANRPANRLPRPHSAKPQAMPRPSIPK